jgi:hypothetical protein
MMFSAEKVRDTASADECHTAAAAAASRQVLG